MDWVLPVFGMLILLAFGLLILANVLDFFSNKLEGISEKNDQENRERNEREKREKEEARWNSLTPEAQRAESIERELDQDMLEYGFFEELAPWRYESSRSGSQLETTSPLEDCAWEMLNAAALFQVINQLNPSRENAASDASQFALRWSGFRSEDGRLFYSKYWNEVQRARFLSVWNAYGEDIRDFYIKVGRSGAENWAIQSILKVTGHESSGAEGELDPIYRSLVDCMLELYDSKSVTSEYQGGALDVLRLL
jgi:hypothetical protein